MEIQELMNKIRLPEEAQETVVRFFLEEEMYNEKKDLFYKDTRAFLREWKESENHLQWLLSFYSKLALEVYEEYKRQGIAEKIFVDTFVKELDVRIADMHEDVYSEVYLPTYYWGIDS